VSGRIERGEKREGRESWEKRRGLFTSVPVRALLLFPFYSHSPVPYSPVLAISLSLFFPCSCSHNFTLPFPVLTIPLPILTITILLPVLTFSHSPPPNFTLSPSFPFPVLTIRSQFQQFFIPPSKWESNSAGNATTCSTQKLTRTS